MNQETLYKKLAEVADKVVASPNWVQDDIGVEVFGYIIYGYALALGRFTMALDVEEIDKAVLRCLVENIGAAQLWSSGLVDAANLSAFDPENSPVEYELVGIGHSYCFETADEKTILENLLANTIAHREAALSS